MRTSCLLALSLFACTSSAELTSNESELVVGIDPAKELVITDPSVIASPVETTFDPARPSGHHHNGAWSFGRLVHNMLPAGERDSSTAASRLVMDWLRTWEADQAPNPEVSAAKARASIRLLVTEPWKTASGCDPSPATDATCVLDLAKAPFRLIAIVNRPDLRRVTNDATAIGGEGRFVFQVVGPTLGVDAVTGALRVMNPTVKPQKFTVIFEYSLPVFHRTEVLAWAKQWHVLRNLPFGNAFNAKLRTITNEFSGADRDPRRPNGNALNQLRTNEVALMGARFPTDGFVAAKQFWELREFHLTTGGLAPHTVNLEPSRDFDTARTGQTGNEGTRAAELEAFLADEATAIAAEKHALWPGMSGNSALVGSAPYGAWAITGDVAVRNTFALNTCAGCHRHETDTRHFMHITTVAAMEPADKVDDRARIGVGPETPEDKVVLSNLLSADIAPGGKRHEDYAKLLVTKPSQL